jgi:hypothetical protein
MVLPTACFAAAWAFPIVLIYLLQICVTEEVKGVFLEPTPSVVRTIAASDMICMEGAGFITYVYHNFSQYSMLVSHGQFR